MTETYTSRLSLPAVGVDHVLRGSILYICVNFIFLTLSSTNTGLSCAMIAIERLIVGIVLFGMLLSNHLPPSRMASGQE